MERAFVEEIGQIGAGHAGRDARDALQVDGRSELETLGVHGQDGLWQFAAEAGAQGFLLKDASPEDLCEAITRVAAGETLLAPVPTDPVRARYAYRDQAAPTDTFSEREVAILRLLAGGYSNKEIARTLFLAEGTVKNYVSTILDKLGTRDRTRAVLKAITLRII